MDSHKLYDEMLHRAMIGYVRGDEYEQFAEVVVDLLRLYVLGVCETAYNHTIKKPHSTDGKYMYRSDEPLSVRLDNIGMTRSQKNAMLRDCPIEAHACEQKKGACNNE